MTTERSTSVASISGRAGRRSRPWLGTTGFTTASSTGHANRPGTNIIPAGALSNSPTPPLPTRQESSSTEHSLEAGQQRLADRARYVADREQEHCVCFSVYCLWLHDADHNISPLLERRRSKPKLLLPSASPAYPPSPRRLPTSPCQATSSARSRSSILSLLLPRRKPKSTSRQLASILTARLGARRMTRL